MEKHFKLQIALKVLSAISLHLTEPDPANIALLRSYAESDLERRMRLDELGRTVVLRELERNWNQQRMAAGWMSFRATPSTGNTTCAASP
jgi:hypothetical protein